MVVEMCELKWLFVWIGFIFTKKAKGQGQFRRGRGDAAFWKSQRHILHFVFVNFFNSPLLINKLFEENIYAIGTVRSNRKHMPKLKDKKKMVRGESDFQFSKNVICSKWFGNKPVLLLATNIEGMDGTSNVMRLTKGSATKASVFMPK